ncbi:hypothetical protein RFI_35467 [Reticulomyxa filosa]|uniref:Uncharacterized protein n=1 Tax=Reticulomyxa filosa TaxID=46433 RepID=X6LLG5_RETFI|nr:hypothetical protein RFI_35467 [Reticulomyxa filosa]|eukprot:ETO01972.1 hypothetical protein RFI_35467 [Reticulomyxa filosa]
MTTEPTNQNKKCQLKSFQSIEHCRKSKNYNQMSRDLRKNIGKPYKQLLKMTYTSTIKKTNKLVLHLNRNSNVDNFQYIVNDINAAVSCEYTICHVSDSEFKTKEVVLKGIGFEEDIADIQSELENGACEIAYWFHPCTIINNNIKNIETKDNNLKMLLMRNNNNR